MSSLSIRDSKVAYNLILGAVNTYEFLLYHASKFILTPLLRAVVGRRMKRIADVTINPEEKSAKPGDLRVYNDKFYAMMAAYHSLGVGNAYMEGMWDSTDLEEFFFKSFSSDLQYEMDTFPSWHKFINYLKFGLFNLQTPTRSWEVGQKHYDLSNDLFEKMLDKTMTYSCGYWKNADNLDAAQINKLDLLARKLELKPGMKVLDIGCGWGGLCKYFAEVYKVEMVGCTISVEGARMGRVRCKGLPVDIRVVDYRDMNETFDRIVSVGMFEHVGHRNYRTFFEVVHRCLKDDGLFALHTIAVNTKKMPIFDGWVNTYIFPNGSLPYPESICEASDDYFIIEDWQNMGYHYHKTLRAWLENFNKHWPSLKKNYEEPEKFYRMWTFYLCMSSALFKSRRMQLWQVVFTKKGMAGGYDAPR